MSAGVQIWMPLQDHTEFTLLRIQFLDSGLLTAASLQRNSIIVCRASSVVSKFNSALAKNWNSKWNSDGIFIKITAIITTVPHRTQKLRQKMYEATRFLDYSTNLNKIINGILTSEPVIAYLPYFRE